MKWNIPRIIFIAWLFISNILYSGLFLLALILLRWPGPEKGDLVMFAASFILTVTAFFSMVLLGIRNKNARITITIFLLVQIIYAASMQFDGTVESLLWRAIDSLIITISIFGLIYIWKRTHMRAFFNEDLPNSSVPTSIQSKPSVIRIIFLICIALTAFYSVVGIVLTFFQLIWDPHPVQNVIVVIIYFSSIAALISLFIKHKNTRAILTIFFLLRIFGSLSGLIIDHISWQQLIALIFWLIPYIFALGYIWTSDHMQTKILK